MTTVGDRKVTSALVGLLITLGLGAAGFGLLIAAMIAGAPAWLGVLDLALVVGGTSLYALLVYRAHRQQDVEIDQLRRDRLKISEMLIEALDGLRSGDLVGSAESAQGTPDRVASAFTNATSSLAVLAQQIQTSSVEVAAEANSVNQTSSELASGSSEQAASVVEITAAMEQLARTASQIADNASVQAELAQKAEEAGNVGAAAVEEAVQGVDEVRKRISGIANRADTLGTRSKEIYRVLDLITEISQETHILSLNAAIEAAAAGEHGRRFSVVAEEVRRLAQRSQESVESVRNLLDEFAGSIRATVVATEEGSKEAARVLERTQAAAAAIEELRRASSDTARVAREISLATQQQNAASDEVVLTLKEVSQVVQRMADGLKQFSTTAERLNELALTIQLLAQSFHLDSPRSVKHRAYSWSQELERRSGNWEAIEGVLEQLVEQTPYVELAYVVDSDGGQISVVVNREVVGPRDVPNQVRAAEGLTERLWFRSVMRERRTIITPVYDSLLSDEPCFTVAAPIFDGRAQILAVLGMDVNLGHWTHI